MNSQAFAALVPLFDSPTESRDEKPPLADDDWMVEGGVTEVSRKKRRHFFERIHQEKRTQKDQLASSEEGLSCREGLSIWLDDSTENAVTASIVKLITIVFSSSILTLVSPRLRKREENPRRESRLFVTLRVSCSAPSK